jgi:hypothetical protein
MGSTDEHLFLDPTQPLTNIMYSSAGWEGIIIDFN